MRRTTPSYGGASAPSGATAAASRPISGGGRSPPSPTRADTAATTCAAAAFSTRERADLDAAAAAYYSDPAWFASFPDGPAYPGSGCTTKYFTDGRKQHGALCFDAACAPPDVKRFTCGPRAS